MPATGHAVQTFGKILVNTISDTPRAAMVNWLVTVPQVMILQRHSDDDIVAAFDQFTTKEAAGSRVVEVVIIAKDAP